MLKLFFLSCLASCNAATQTGDLAAPGDLALHDLAAPGDLALHDLAAPGDLSRLACVHDSDCRSYSSYCDSCSCLALGAGDPDPVCSGTVISCFLDPCSGKQAVCAGGSCAIQ